ncbi:MAG TPA: CBS domain-containing protein, partial [Cytophagaceae bacterium]|nr:CBS domain-containing protein [Cytophagaceae bacterium]
HDLAPTTSTTAALALGDALAICLLEMREFSSKDFAKFHPGGSLGRKLYLKVSDIYPHHSVPAVKDDAKIKDIIMEISSKRLGVAAVINKKKELIGVITDGDLRRMLNKHKDISSIKASDIMTKSPKTIDADEYAVNALKMMQDKNITQLIVVKNNKLAGFVHIHDLLKEGLV